VANQDQRDFAAWFFNETWALLDRADRTAAEDMQMIHLAHASRAHWQEAGGVREWAIGEWQIARVYAVLGHGEAALRHARESLHRAEEADDMFLLASAHEGLARAYRAAGDDLSAQDHIMLARAAAAEIADHEDRAVILDDLPPE
jgi:tetratricopeptide (TPR) repeat protein